VAQGSPPPGDVANKLLLFKQNVHSKNKENFLVTKYIKNAGKYGESG